MDRYKTNSRAELLPEIRVIRSRRKTMCLEITPRGEVILRAPYTMKEEKIRQFILDKQQWIRNTLKKVEEMQKNSPEAAPLTEEELNRLADQALEVLPQKVRFYAAKMGVTVGRITIRCQKTRWGSCTREGNLNFNCLLMLAPDEAQNYVVVHELCHRLEMNHSKRFWAQVEKVMPDYKKQQQWFREHGGELMARRPEVR